MEGRLIPLSRLEPYKHDRVVQVAGHAVVLGGSIAGLLAARVLADGFERVAIVERDPIDEVREARHGAPQATHFHALLLAGRRRSRTCSSVSPMTSTAGGPTLDLMSELSVDAAGDFVAVPAVDRTAGHRSRRSLPALRFAANGPADARRLSTDLDRRVCSLGLRAVAGLQRSRAALPDAARRIRDVARPHADDDG
jgi:hypothetical protein